MKMNRRMQSLEARANDALKKHREERKALSDTIRILSDGNDLVGSLLPVAEDQGSGALAPLDLPGIASAAGHCRAEQGRKLKMLEDKYAHLEEGHAREIAAIETRVRRAVAEQLAAPPREGGNDTPAEEQRAHGAQPSELAKLSFLSSEVDRLVSENQVCWCM
jgi:predicted  nucleic acid-binding Zn-ribbon protein